MNPTWDPAEADSDLYQKVHRHSDGMISLTVTRDSTDPQSRPLTDAFREFVAPQVDSDERERSGSSSTP